MLNSKDVFLALAITKMWGRTVCLCPCTSRLRRVGHTNITASDNWLFVGDWNVRAAGFFLSGLCLTEPSCVSRRRKIFAKHSSLAFCAMVNRKHGIFGHDVINWIAPTHLGPSGRRTCDQHESSSVSYLWSWGDVSAPKQLVVPDLQLPPNARFSQRCHTRTMVHEWSFCQSPVVRSIQSISFFELI